MTEAELTIFLNEKLCDIADVLLDYYDCCGIEGASCKAGEVNPCCTGKTKFGHPCPFWNGKCGFRNADCKLWLCETAVKSTDPKCVEALTLLEKFGLLFNLVRGPIIGQRYSGGDKQ